MNVSKLLKILVLLVIVTIVLIVAIALIPKSGPDSTANKFVSSLLKGDAQADYNITTPSFKEATSESLFQSNVQYIDTACSGAPTIQSSQQSGSLDNLVYIVKGQTICRITVELQKDNAGWQVSFVN